MMSARVALLLVVLVSFAGCNAPTAADTGQPTVKESPAETESTTTPPSQTESAANSSTIPVEGGRLGTDPDQTFQRVSRQLGVDVRPPERIRIVDPSDTAYTAEPPDFLQVFGVQAPSSGTGFAAQTLGEELIRVNQSVATRPRIDGVLAHEYVHVIQNRRGVTGRLIASGVWEPVPAFGVEQPFLVRSVREGIATYVADQYQRAYTDTLPQGTRYGQLYRQRKTAGWRYFMAPYWFGYRYVADRVADNETIGSVYDRPPRTTEAMIHRLDPGSEPPANLSVNVTADQWQPDDRGRVGELGTRMALLANLNVSQARDGADGWGNDLLVPFEQGSRRGYVWVARWDDPANETEFRAVLTAALDRRATRTDEGWRDGDTAFRVRQGDDRTTVVVAGPSEFVRNASATVGRQVVIRGP